MLGTRPCEPDVSLASRASKDLREHEVRAGEQADEQLELAYAGERRTAGGPDGGQGGDHKAEDRDPGDGTEVDPGTARCSGGGSKTPVSTFTSICDSTQSAAPPAPTPYFAHPRDPGNKPATDVLRAAIRSTA